MFTNHVLDSKSTGNYYIFTVNRKVKDIDARLVKLVTINKIRILY